MSKDYDIGLNNFDTETRVKAKFDFISFWDSQAKKLSWFQSWVKTIDWNPPFARWFVGGKINASYNALDIHQNNKAEKLAILWEGEDGQTRQFTYKELYRDVCKFANVLKSLGVKNRDRVTIYLPMVPEILIAMLACARIGAIHTVVFSGFSSTSLRDRIDDSKSKIIITADVGFRRGNTINLKDKTFVVYTDGVTEGYLKNGQELGAEGVQRIVTELDNITPKNLVDSIANELNWGAEKLRDDITCLALDLKNTELVKKISNVLRKKPLSVKECLIRMREEEGRKEC